MNLYIVIIICVIFLINIVLMWPRDRWSGTWKTSDEPPAKMVFSMRNGNMVLDNITTGEMNIPVSIGPRSITMGKFVGVNDGRRITWNRQKNYWVKLN